jgi:hypothetical protein
MRALGNFGPSDVRVIDKPEPVLQEQSNPASTVFGGAYGYSRQHNQVTGPAAR